MDILPLNFRILRYCGIWYELPEHLWLVKIVYKIFVVVVIFSFTLSELIELALTYDDLQNLTECLFLTLTFLALCFKMINFMCRQESLKALLNTFRDEICQPKTLEEKDIIEKNRSMLRLFCISYFSLGILSGSTLVFVPFASFKSSKIELPIKTYQPYDVEDFVLFSLTYFHQILSMYLGVLINVSLDMLVCGFIFLTCGQLDLCYYRIVSSNMYTMNNNIRHHAVTKDIVKKMQSFSIVVVVPLFIFSLITLCTSLFLMPEKEIMSFEFITLFIYLTCMLTQIFLYCWFGNELQLKSKTISDAVYHSNWTRLTPKLRRNLLFTMFISQNGLMISFHGQCSLSINTYVSILKTSYAAFNLLRKTSNTLGV
ncbi:odorant receptor 124 [Nasonia vitripennis]|uniref:Odorant receptor n=1 Tax=Nasonia vitripennis TaxID=7425 RepID=A0A7M6UPN5_NASVI|nr:odorant receptor 124 [Nasonia vitripennis]